MQVEFKVIGQTSDFERAKALFREYAASLPFDLGFQNFELELEEIAVQYGKPHGGLILGIDRGTNEAVGCVGVRKQEGEIGELKRMYLRDQYRGKGLGKRLLTEALALSKSLGYRKIRLDTVSTMEAAIQLYQSVGFYEIEPYRYNPHDARYFEIEL